MLAKAAAKSRPFCPTKEEMQIAPVNWIKDNKPELLKCKAKKFLHDWGHLWLWILPYCAKLQPIKLFWATGKQYAMYHAFNGQTMKQTVQLL
eukprot:1620516-Ditylum_brightwellii.AAC.1